MDKDTEVWSNIQWNIIERYFKDDPYCLVKHHIDSFNKFFENDIFNIIREKNPVKYLYGFNDTTNEFELKCDMFIGGKQGNLLYYGKPIIYDGDNVHFMFPNEARLRNMNYGITVHFDIDLVFTTIQNGTSVVNETRIEKVLLGRFPIMLHSNLCIFKNMGRQFCFNAGECKNDKGGYFIIDGKEKTLVMQEQFANNMINISDKGNETYSHHADIRSVSEDASKPVRTMSVKIVAPSPNLTNNNIVVDVPNVRKPVPLFILMRALGITSDKAIIQHCLLDMQKYENYVDLFIPSIHDANKIFTQNAALEYIKTFTKGKTVAYVQEILMDYFLPHIGVDNFKAKALFLGHIVFSLLKVFVKDKKPVDRDNFKYKRVELSGSLIYNLFNEYYKQQIDAFNLKIDKEYTYKQNIYQDDFSSLFLNNYNEFFKDRIVENGFRKGFKGNWGGTEHTKRPGAVQDLNRLSFNSALSHLRKVNLEIDSTAKVVAPRLLHGSQWGFIDPVDTPDGGNIGFHKHMSITTHVTSGYSKYPLMELLFNEFNITHIEKAHALQLSNSVKIFVNGHWFAITEDPVSFVEQFKIYRHISLIPIQTSIYWEIETHTIYLYTDAGRLSRPVFYIDSARNPSYERYTTKLSWLEMTSGSNKKQVEYDFNAFYTMQELYGDKKGIKELIAGSSILEFIDASEEEGTYISVEKINDYRQTRHTNIEIHPSLILGIMGNQIVFPENNQLPRDLFSCGQSKQAVSLYHSNYHNRIDKMGVVLNNGQIPLIKSRYSRLIHNEEHPYGENVMVAIMCYTGYNVEDAILFNEGSVKRGLFRTTYFNMYEARESSSSVAGSNEDSIFTNIKENGVLGVKPGYDYSDLNELGLIRENSPVDDKTVIIGKAVRDANDPSVLMDSSITPKKGQLGFIDKSFVTTEEEGFRLAKVRIREERIPAIGDKFCSRCGQKGTLGQLIPEADMPYTSNGVRPDIIINPHAIPSRMTIGQLIETVMGKACLEYGGFGDCTAFNNKGTKLEEFGNMLQNMGYNSTGNELLYNGMTGEQINTQVFFGPTYYMRLKHMVKDKINYRALGPRTMLTRQTVQGRANDGGLRIGEMERDCLIAHGITKFLNESMMERGDKYHMAICNSTGHVAVYNESKNIFISPMADGPIQYTSDVEGNLNVRNVTRYGRNFSVICVPYAFKLLLQELASMNVHMKVITEDNIDNIQNMQFSKTISRLTMDDNVQPAKLQELNKMLYEDSITVPAPVIPPEEGDEEEEEEEEEEVDEEQAPVQDADSEVVQQDIEEGEVVEPVISVAGVQQTAQQGIDTATQAYRDNVPEEVQEIIGNTVTNVRDTASNAFANVFGTGEVEDVTEEIQDSATQVEQPPATVQLPEQIAASQNVMVPSQGLQQQSQPGITQTIPNITFNVNAQSPVPISSVVTSPSVVPPPSMVQVEEPSESLQEGEMVAGESSLVSATEDMSEGASEQGTQQQGGTKIIKIN